MLHNHGGHKIDAISVQVGDLCEGGAKVSQINMWGKHPPQCHTHRGKDTDTDTDTDTTQKDTQTKKYTQTYTQRHTHTRTRTHTDLAEKTIDLIV